MFGRLLLVALVLALADALFLLVVAGWIGALATVGLVVLTALVGSVLVRNEGRATLARLRERLRNLESPTDELLDGVLIVLGGGFLITPGLLTDLTGFLFVLPVTRAPIRAALERWVIAPSIRGSLGDGAFDVHVGGGLGGAWGDPGSAGNGDTDSSERYYDLDEDMYDVEDDGRS